MSENNQKPQNNDTLEKSEHAAGAHGRRRNRRRSHANRSQQDHAERTNNNAQNNAQSNGQNNKENKQKNASDAPQNREEGRNRQQQNRNQNQKQDQAQGNQKKNGKQGNHKNRNGQRGRGNNRHEPEGRLYNPYETPNKTEIELSELRARIVMQAADGSKPVAFGSSPTTEAEALPVTKLAPDSEEFTEELSLDAYPALDESNTKDQKKVEVVGVRFRSSGKMYYFDPHGIHAKKGDAVIVETTRGPEFGDVCLGNSMVNAGDTVAPLRPVLRIATPADVTQNEENREKEKKALVVCQEKIEAHKLDMKLIDVQYAFDGSKLLFYFASEGRVDFRELVKDLASVFRTRIELRQIGIRDEAKMLGGIGACGRALCCSTFLPDFAQVSIKMAKDQNLSLNSAKISGVCGRLMCCLRYESEVYAEEIKKTPSHDALVRTEDGIGTVISSNPLAGTVRVVLKDSPDTAPKQYHRDNVTVLPKEKKRTEESKNDTEK